MASYLAVALWKIPKPDELRDEIEDQGVVETIDNPAEEGVHLEENTLLTELIELRVPIEQASRDILVKDSEYERRQHGEDDVVETQRPRLEDNFTGEGILERVPELGHEEGGILVIEVEDDFRDALVGPGTVHQKELSKVSELRDCNVGGSCSLKTFDTGDTNTDMCSLNHGDIVRTVADSKKDSLQVSLDKLYDKCFLKGRYTARVRKVSVD